MIRDQRPNIKDYSLRFNRRLSLLPRPRLLLEKAILALGMVLVLLDGEWWALV